MRFQQPICKSTTLPKAYGVRVFIAKRPNLLIQQTNSRFLAHKTQKLLLISTMIAENLQSIEKTRKIKPSKISL
jgi:hypothetical protein